MFIISPNFDILPLNYEQNDKGYKKKRQKPSKKKSDVTWKIYNFIVELLTELEINERN